MVEAEAREMIQTARKAVSHLNLTELHHVALLASEPPPGAVYYASGKFWCTPIEDGIEIVTFEPDSPFHPLLKENGHVCFTVKDITPFVSGRFPVLLDPFDCSMGRAAFIHVEPVVVELLEMKEQF